MIIVLEEGEQHMAIGPLRGPAGCVYDTAGYAHSTRVLSIVRPLRGRELIRISIQSNCG